MAKDNPHNLALVLGGLHAQMARPNSVTDFLQAELHGSGSSSSSSSSTAGVDGGDSRGSKGGRADGSKAADASLYCPSHLSRLPPQATSVAKVARQAASFWLQVTSKPIHKRTTLEVLPEELLTTCIGAVAAMNTPAHDPLCPLILQLGSSSTAAATTAAAFPTQGQGHLPLQQQHFPTSATWQALLQSPAARAASPNLVPDSVWLQLVGQQLCALQQQQQQQQQGNGKRAPRAKQQQQLLLARHARFEDTLAALQALQMRGAAGIDGVTALSRYMHTGSDLLAGLQLPPAAEEQKGQLEGQSMRSGRLISAAVMLKSRVPGPYVQRFLDQTICQVGFLLMDVVAICFKCGHQSQSFAFMMATNAQPSTFT
eukprot:132467-Pelagomonas_calceolata.AAC.6